jgi:tetratricopeptide (TPR) repeat protein
MPPFRNATRSSLAVLAVGAALVIATGCRGGRRALIPGPETVAASPDANQPYVVRMSDGVRDWEVEFPESATGYEVRIPLRGAASTARLEDLPDAMTDADRELLSELRRTEEPMEREGVFRDGEDLVTGEPEDGATAEGEPAAQSDEEPAPSRPSYLLGISEVRRLYRGGNPEVAMVRLTRLLRAYPDDTRLLAMKGTLWLRLGRPELARRAYEEVLHREPDNRAVQQALRRLQQSPGDDTSLESDFPAPTGAE